MSEQANADVSSSADRSSRCEQVLLDYLQQRRLGNEVSDDDIIKQHPDLMPELAERLKALGEISTGGADQQTVPLAMASSSQQHANTLNIRCPHCSGLTAITDDARLAEVSCKACGSSFSIASEETATVAHKTIEVLGHFELVEQLGEGSFGTVFKARDTRLDRNVAIKIPRREQLGADEIEKFLREARTAAQLSHPNIVSVHEVGRHDDSVFIVSDLIRGVPLSDWLTVHEPNPMEAAKICEQIAVPLHHAHEAGVVHRDLKPQNILIDDAGELYLTDFGLARRERGEVTVTHDGYVLGTPAYMSPEQARGEAHRADRRTDIYSLGVILFQILTGELPFQGSSRLLLHQVMSDEPNSPRRLKPSIPKDLETICLKCLQKEPDQRYATAAELADDLGRFQRGDAIKARPVSTIERSWRWCRKNPSVAGLTVAVMVLVVALASFFLFSPPASDSKIRSLAVVLGAADDNASVFRADMSRDLIRQLSQLSQLEVPPRKDVLAYEDGDEVKARQVAKALDVDAVLKGELSVTNDESFDLVVHVVDRKNGGTIWQRDYREMKLTSLPAVQRGVLKAVVDALALELTASEELQINTSPSIHADALDAYFAGRVLYSGGTKKALLDAVDHYKLAIALEPNWAHAHSALAHAYVELGYFYGPPDVYYPLADKHVQHARNLDPTSLNAVATQGAIDYFYHWDWKKAQVALQTILREDPSLIEQQPCYIHLQSTIGNSEQALQLVQDALLRYPQSTVLKTERACAAYYAHQFDDSIRYADNVLRSDPYNAFVLWHRARARNQKGDYGLANRDCELALSEGPWSMVYAEMGYAYARNRDIATEESEQKALQMIKEMKHLEDEAYVDPYEYAMVYAGLANLSGQKGKVYARKTMQHLKEAEIRKSAWLISVNAEPKFKSVRDDGEFKQLLRRLAVEAWEK